MLKEIISTDIFVTKAHALKRRKFRGGFDGMSMDGAAAWLSINGARLCKDILSGDYRLMLISRTSQRKSAVSA